MKGDAVTSLADPLSSSSETGVAPLTYRVALSQTRSLDLSGSPRISLTLGGNGNPEFLLPGLRVGAAEAGYGVDVTLTEYDDWSAAALRPTSTRTDFWIIWLSALAFSRGGIERRAVNLDGISQAVDALIAKGVRPVVILPEVLDSEIDPTSGFGAWRRELCAALASFFPPAKSILFDPLPLQIQYGAGWSDGRYWTLAKTPAHPNAATRLGYELGRLLAAAMRPRVRALVTDLDGTLWGGVVGDDGVGALALDPEGEGRPYLVLQRMLKDLADAGIALCACTKNEDAIARDVFARRDEMILSLDDFAVFDTGWGSKPARIAAIAERLNLGVDALCFLDDSPHERSEARAFLPDLIVPELSADPQQRPASLYQSGLFQVPIVHGEDRARGAFYRTEAKRSALRSAAVTESEFLAALNLRLLPVAIDLDTVDRCVTLLQKTNQFCLNGWRPDRARLLESAVNPNVYAWGFRLEDKFGDAGLISVLVALLREGTVEIRNWVLSCRVFNRGVEQAIGDHLNQWLDQKGAIRIEAAFELTPKNAYALRAMQGLGLRAADSVGPSCLTAARLQTAGHFVTTAAP